MAEIRLSVRALVEFLLQRGSIDSRAVGFDRALEGARIHRRLQKAAGEGYEAEVSLLDTQTVDGISYQIEGRADGIFTDEDGCVTIDEIKTTTVPCSSITEDMTPCHWAQGMVYAAIYGSQQHLDALSVQLTYYQMDEDRIIRFVRHFTLIQLQDFYQDLLLQYTPWAKRQQKHTQQCMASLAALRFPFSTWRAGQHAMSGAVYRTCKEPEGRLFCQAPTGIGKTMSTLFPALKSMGEGCGEKIFYLTARSTVRTAAEEAVTQLRQTNADLVLRAITLTAKDKVCLCPNAEGRPECLPERCPYAKGYFDRILGAMEDILSQDVVLSQDTISAFAKKHQVCPFEMQLSLSEWCDVVIGDYNYLFDPVVHLQRFFDAKGDWLFLIDEAHNLPSRARAMHSASFSKSQLLEARRALGKGKSSLKSALGQANDFLLQFRKALSTDDAEDAFPADNGIQTSLFGQQTFDAEEPLPADSAETGSLFGAQEPLYQADHTRYYKDLPPRFCAPLQKVLSPAQHWLEDHKDGPAHETILQLYFSLRAFLRVAEQYDSHYVTQWTVHGSELEINLLCLDPSAFVERSLNRGRSAVLFSATITPPGYYKTVLGCPDASAVALQSPFSADHLGLYCLGNISTRYRDRQSSLQPIAAALAAMVQARQGNYLAFFPSYAYLKQVQQMFTELYPEIPVLAQESGLDEAARADFLARFSAENEQTLLGFCVMGGVFGEGIDLAGDRLIGCAVVGVGLPQVNPQQDILRQYYDAPENGGCGFDYAYRFPGMNKVLQAAGRVIRTPQDKGVVLLIDDRFTWDEYRRLMPPHWAHLQYFYDIPAFRAALQDFWNK